MDESILKELMRHNCKQVFTTMLDTSIREIPGDSTAIAAEERIISLIGFGGEHTGNCLIACSKRLACKLASIMLMGEYATVNEEVMDAFGEISNMVFGNVKTDLEEHLGPLRLTIPTVIVGERFNIRALSNPTWTVLQFAVFDGEEVEVRMCVAPTPSSCVVKADVPERVHVC